MAQYRLLRRLCLINHGPSRASSHWVSITRLRNKSRRRQAPTFLHVVCCAVRCMAPCFGMLNFSVHGGEQTSSDSGVLNNPNVSSVFLAQNRSGSSMAVAGYFGPIMMFSALKLPKTNSETVINKNQHAQQRKPNSNRNGTH